MTDQRNSPVPGSEDETLVEPYPQRVETQRVEQQVVDEQVVEEEVVTANRPATPPPPGVVVDEPMGPRVVTQDERVRVEDDGSVTRRVERFEQEPARRRFGPSSWVPALLVILLLAAAAIGAAWYFSQSNTKSVPGVEGLALDSAVATLQDKGFKTDIVSEPNPAAQGTVFRQSPTAGTKADEGSKVQLLVSKGPSDVSIPNAVGVSETEARDRLAAAGLKATSVQIFAQEPVGQVVAQSPVAGGKAAKGSTVRLNVSKGSGVVTVPTVVGSLAADGESKVQAAGLKPNVIRVPSQETAGTIVAQNPTGGQAKRGSTVRLNVSTGSTK